MPCNCDGYDPPNDVTLRRHLEHVTALLCLACSSWPGGDMPPPLVQEWWSKHQERDKLREKREALKAEVEAINKRLAEGP